MHREFHDTFLTEATALLEPFRLTHLQLVLLRGDLIDLCDELHAKDRDGLYSAAACWSVLLARIGGPDNLAAYVATLEAGYNRERARYSTSTDTDETPF